MLFSNRTETYSRTKGLGVGPAPKRAGLGVSEEPTCRVCCSKYVLGAESWGVCTKQCQLRSFPTSADGKYLFLTLDEVIRFFTIPRLCFSFAKKISYQLNNRALNL